MQTEEKALRSGNMGLDVSPHYPPFARICCSQFSELPGSILLETKVQRQECPYASILKVDRPFQRWAALIRYTCR